MKKILLPLLALMAIVSVASADEALDPDYMYTEPTLVTNTDELGSNIENYSFICNNVQVEVTKGARYAAYFGVNAGASVTFTTTRPMKALVVNGYIKKFFEATASSGTIAFADAEEDAVEAEQVLAVTDIDASTLTINCVKQLRCYSVAIYFEANPEIDIPTDGEEDYSFEWEPQEATTLNITFDSIEVNDMTEMLGYACTGLYFITGEYEMDLSVFASTVEQGTILPVGTYPINDTYEANTVMASPGGYDEFDFPSNLITDFEYNPLSGSWMYNTVYYLAGGTLEVSAVEGGVEMELHATTHFGSTVNAVFRSDGQEDAVGQVAPDRFVGCTKLLRNGHMLIERNGAVFSIEGLRL